jgi:hypothetical protein
LIAEIAITGESADNNFIRDLLMYVKGAGYIRVEGKRGEILLSALKFLEARHGS